MFESVVDTEQTFGQPVAMDRTRVRRRRLGAVVALVATVALGAPAAASAFGRPDPASGPPRYVVRAGDTLWDVATRTAPHDDPREVVARLVEDNDLGGAAIAPGQVLVLSAG